MKKGRPVDTSGFLELLVFALKILAPGRSVTITEANNTQCCGALFFHLVMAPDLLELITCGWCDRSLRNRYTLF